MTKKRAGRGPSQRQLRVGEELRHVLAELFQRGDFRDPDLQNVTVTVTEVRVSADLRNATAFVTPLGGQNADEVLTALRRAVPFLRGQIARAVKLQFVPTLTFQQDSSFDYADHIDRLLKREDVSRDLEPRGTMATESADDAAPTESDEGEDRGR